MTGKITVTGVKDFKFAMDRLGKSFDDAVTEGLFLVANDIRTHAIKSIMQQSFGTHVRRSKQGGGTYGHIAAKPGSAPNNDTGGLVRSIAAEKLGPYRYTIGSNLPYAGWLEFGTTKMGARPWLEPAFRAESVGVVARIQQAVNIKLKAAAS
tara:strand:- start:76 stop:531 length:456 start_codon:yes stop_codon:yes gene_type:complete